MLPIRMTTLAGLGTVVFFFFFFSKKPFLVSLCISLCSWLDIPEQTSLHPDQTAVVE